jgi:6-pyruvoyltetrahydropterin/6-carboxytetrahydropterin synthase
MVQCMYTIGVRDHIMVAHSLPGEIFGPAQRLHGATYTVTAELSREELTDAGIVTDLGELGTELHAVLADLHYRNLDEHPAFRGRRSTGELIARHIHRELGRRLPGNLSATLTITLDESPVAWARYAAPLRAGSSPARG